MYVAFPGFSSYIKNHAFALGAPTWIKFATKDSALFPLDSMATTCYVALAACEEPIHLMTFGVCMHACRHVRLKCSQQQAALGNDPAFTRKPCTSCPALKRRHSPVVRGYIIYIWLQHNACSFQIVQGTVLSRIAGFWSRTADDEIICDPPYTP